MGTSTTSAMNESGMGSRSGVPRGDAAGGAGFAQPRDVEGRRGDREGTGRTETKYVSVGAEPEPFGKGWCTGDTE